MSKAINFNTLKKQYLTVTLSDEKQTVLLVGMPTKAIMEDIISIQSSLETFDENNADMVVADELYNICAKAMNRNKNGVKITKEYISELFDFEDIMIFLNAYVSFISEATGGKN